MQISVVIVSFKDSPDVKECVMSVLKASGGFNVDTIVVWNDGHGYAEAANKGIKQGLANGSDYICLLNNDTKVDKHFLEWMVKENADICGAKIYDWDSSRMQPYVCSVNMWTGQPKYIPADNRPTDLAQFDHFHDVPGVNGCCMLIKKCVFEKIGYLGESYFAYFEDIDFCYKAKKNGLRIMLAPNAYIWHKGGASSNAAFKTRMITRNRIRFMRKNANKLQLAFFYLYYFGFYLWATLLWHSIYSEDFSNEKAIWEGIIDGCRKLG